MAFSLDPSADGLSVALKFSGVTVATFDSTGKQVLVQNEGQLDMSLFNDKLFATQGYQKLPGGLILQWGNTSTFATSSATRANFTVTLPIAFPNGVLNINCQYQDAASGASTNGPIYTPQINVTLTSFVIGVYATQNGNCSVRWLAIGY